jgi:hypothetical protein
MQGVNVRQFFAMVIWNWLTTIIKFTSTRKKKAHSLGTFKAGTNFSPLILPSLFSDLESVEFHHVLAVNTTKINFPIVIDTIFVSWQYRCFVNLWHKVVTDSGKDTGKSSQVTKEIFIRQREHFVSSMTTQLYETGFLAVTKTTCLPRQQHQQVLC